MTQFKFVASLVDGPLQLDLLLYQYSQDPFIQELETALESTFTLNDAHYKRDNIVRFRDYGSTDVAEGILNSFQLMDRMMRAFYIFKSPVDRAGFEEFVASKGIGDRPWVDTLRVRLERSPQETTTYSDLADALFEEYPNSSAEGIHPVTQYIEKLVGLIVHTEEGMLDQAKLIANSLNGQFEKVRDRLSDYLGLCNISTVVETDRRGKIVQDQRKTNAILQFCEKMFRPEVCLEANINHMGSVDLTPKFRWQAGLEPFVLTDTVVNGVAAPSPAYCLDEDCLEIVQKQLVANFAIKIESAEGQSSLKSENEKHVLSTKAELDESPASLKSSEAPPFATKTESATGAESAEIDVEASDPEIRLANLFNYFIGYIDMVQSRKYMFYVHPEIIDFEGDSYENRLSELNQDAEAGKGLVRYQKNLDAAMAFCETLSGRKFVEAVTAELTASKWIGNQEGDGEAELESQPESPALSEQVRVFIRAVLQANEFTPMPSREAVALKINGVKSRWINNEKAELRRLKKSGVLKDKRVSFVREDHHQVARIAIGRILEIQQAVSELGPYVVAAIGERSIILRLRALIAMTKELDFDRALPEFASLFHLTEGLDTYEGMVRNRPQELLSASLYLLDGPNHSPRRSDSNFNSYLHLLFNPLPVSQLEGFLTSQVKAALLALKTHFPELDVDEMTTELLEHWKQSSDSPLGAITVTVAEVEQFWTDTRLSHSVYSGCNCHPNSEQIGAVYQRRGEPIDFGDDLSCRKQDRQAKDGDQNMWGNVPYASIAVTPKLESQLIAVPVLFNDQMIQNSGEILAPLISQLTITSTSNLLCQSLSTSNINGILGELEAKFDQLQAKEDVAEIRQSGRYLVSCLRYLKLNPNRDADEEDTLGANVRVWLTGKLGFERIWCTQHDIHHADLNFRNDLITAFNAQYIGTKLGDLDPQTARLISFADETNRAAFWNSESVRQAFLEEKDTLFEFAAKLLQYDVEFQAHLEDMYGPKILKKATEFLPLEMIDNPGLTIDPGDIKQNIQIGVWNPGKIIAEKAIRKVAFPLEVFNLVLFCLLAASAIGINHFVQQQMDNNKDSGCKYEISVLPEVKEDPLQIIMGIIYFGTTLGEIYLNRKVAQNNNRAIMRFFSSKIGSLVAFIFLVMLEFPYNAFDEIDERLVFGNRSNISSDCALETPSGKEALGLLCYVWTVSSCIEILISSFFGAYLLIFSREKENVDLALEPDVNLRPASPKERLKIDRLIDSKYPSASQISRPIEGAVTSESTDDHPNITGVHLDYGVEEFETDGPEDLNSDFKSLVDLLANPRTPATLNVELEREGLKDEPKSEQEGLLRK